MIRLLCNDILILNQVRQPQAGAHLVSYNHFSLRVYACVYVCVYTPEGINY